MTMRTEAQSTLFHALNMRFFAELSMDHFKIKKGSFLDSLLKQLFLDLENNQWHF